MHPVRFAAPTGSLPGLDRSPAGFADFPRGVGEVIFPRRLVAFVEVGISKSLALGGDETLLGCSSGGHLHSFTRGDPDIQHGMGFAMGRH
ncbi:MAG: hypothetical protein ACRDOE_14955 [Streptosporangiaceae bacterium]